MCQLMCYDVSYGQFGVARRVALIIHKMASPEHHQSPVFHGADQKVRYG